MHWVGHSQLPDFLLEWKIVGPRTLLHHYYIRSFQCIQMDTADSQALSLWKNIGSSCCLHIVLKQTQLTCRSWRTFIFNLHWVSSGIQFVSCACLMDTITSEVVAASNVFKWMQLTPRHWVCGKTLEVVAGLHIVLKWSQLTCGSQRTFIFNLHWVGSGIQFVGCARLVLH